MGKIKLSDFVAKYLKEKYGITTVFMVSGGGAMHLNNSFGKYFRYIANHHEQGCAFAAEGFARVHQELAVVNVTTGPGGLNCLSGVFGQWTDSVPVLYISGQVKYETMMDSCKDLNLRQLGDQEVDIISVVKPLTKYAATVYDPNKIKFEIDRAVYEALSGRFGPVWLNIPMNVQSAVIEEDELQEFILPPEKKSFNFHTEKIIELLKKSKRPLIVGGHGIRLSGAEKEFVEFVEKYKIPVVTSFNGADVLPTEHPFYVGRIGTIGQRAGNFALQNADLLLELGTRNNIRQVSYNWENFGKNAFKIVVDIDEAELKKPLVKPDLAVKSDVKEFLNSLISNIEHLDIENDSWLDYCKNIKEKYSFKNTKEYSQSGDEINPYYVVRKITENLNSDDLIVSANATPSICLFQAGALKGQRLIMNSGCASMGYGLPCALGASLHGLRTICFEGDGSIMMNLQELETIAFNKLPVKIFLLNNSGYSSIRQTQKNFFNGQMTGSGEDSGVGMPDFSKLAEGFRIKFVKIEKANEIDDKIKEVLKDTEPVLCEVITQKDYNFTPKLSSKTLEDGTIVSPTLEDMFPFLEREEFEKNMI